MHPADKAFVHFVSSFSVPKWPTLNSNQQKTEEAIMYMGLPIYQSKKL